MALMQMKLSSCGRRSSVESKLSPTVMVEVGVGAQQDDLQASARRRHAQVETPRIVRRDRDRLRKERIVAIRTRGRKDVDLVAAENRPDDEAPQALDSICPRGDPVRGAVGVAPLLPEPGDRARRWQPRLPRLQALKR